MRILRLGRFTLTVAIGASLLASCGALPFDSAQGGLAADGTPPIAAPPALPQASTIGSSSEDLLYVANLHKISVFSYPAGELVGRLHIGYDTFGLCSDPNGDVFVDAGSKIFEFAHGGTKPIATMKSKYGFPLQCAFDPTTGNLAVLDTFDTGPDNVAIYENVTGKVHEYEDYGPFYNLVDCVYDGSGNLFVTGTPPVREPHMGMLGELPKGAHAFTNYEVPLKTDYSLLTGIQWDGTYVTAQEQPPDKHYTLLDRITIESSKAKIVSRTKLDGNLITFEWLYSGAAIGFEGQNRNEIGFWPYPAGGGAAKVLSGYGRRFDAATISVAP
jgi:hypothetical protein